MEEARDRLIEERLQTEVAEKMGIAVTPDQVAKGEEEFATRVKLSRDAFVQALAQSGVAEETFRDFVTAGLLWREVVRQRFGQKVTITDQDVDRALADTVPQPQGVRVLFSEIILPATTPAAEEEAMAKAREIRKYTSVDAFSRAARAFSAAPSKARGGRVDWVEVQNLQPGLAQILLALAPGQVSAPLAIPNAVALFQLRAIDDKTAAPPVTAVADYATLLIPGGRSPTALAEAAKIEGEARNCSELYAAARKHKDTRLDRQSKPMAQIPADVALELAKLDESEVSTALTRGNDLAMLMLCKRQVALPDNVTRDQVKSQLQNRQLQAYADSYLAELRADAILRYP
jgi:peptidyl-prolyl cis-trans isomerase SurA